MEFDGSGFSGWVGVIYPILIGVIGWFVRQARQRAEDREENSKALSAMEKSFNEKVGALERRLLTDYHDSDELEKALNAAVAPIAASVQRIERFIEAAFPVNGHKNHDFTR